MTIIDLTDKLNDIRHRYPQWWRSDEAERELRATWGNPDINHCNDCGVLTERETIRIDLDAQKSWYGELRIAIAPNGWYAVAACYWYGLGGGGSSPSVWNRTAYTTRDEAIDAGIKELITTFEGVRDQKGYQPSNQSANAIRMIETLKAYMTNARQMTLF
jgi:hypothetical protein